ncbi:RecB family exonuclease [Thermasporomyces composti]|jgi:RecB family exonuclease|uniref:RecB family exonuclease n=1 Tax=Thermasporomyces composti TaxID=696763 RepID=A0A3D9V237_THECX|nr:PD-(D/E)XK nuclease family protein [Thermasporomyces composti]REF35539.1 RecB family exonuclease [Thermasporomyces composti]
MTAPQQLGFDAMPRRLFRATPTRLMSWLDCPRRYRFSYLERPTPPKGPPWAHNSVGAAVHTALAGWWRLPPDERTPNAAGDLLVRSWIDEGFRDAAQSLRWRDYTRGMVERYVAELDPLDEPVGVERTVALTTSTLALSGRVDRIDERVLDDGQGVELVVVDYKTGRRTLTTADARTSLALAIYAAAASRTLRRPCRRVELHHLPTGAVVAWDHTPESLARHLSRADSIGEEAAAAEEAYARGLSPSEQDELFPPRPGPQCQWCDFAAHCPEGRRAYPTRLPWDGLDSTVG